MKTLSARDWLACLMLGIALELAGLSALEASAVAVFVGLALVNYE